MAERLHELNQTTSTVQLRGVITGTKSNRFYKSGTGKNGGAWNAIEMGVKIAENETVYVKLNGFPRPEVFYYKKGEGKAKGDTQKVAWKNRHKSPGEGYRLIGVNISTGKDENGKNINKSFTEYDAVEWIHENIHDGDSVLIRGSLEFSSYTDKNGQIRRKVDIVPNQISYTNEPIDLDDPDCKTMAEFENVIVFSSIDKEEDENGKATGRFVLSGYSIGYNTVEPVSFIIDAEHVKVANAIKKKMRPGNAIKTYGRVVIKNNIETVVEEDPWGSTETSPFERVVGPTIREYMVYKVDGSTFDTETYSEESIAQALRKIKAAKTAKENFGEKPSAAASDDADDWGSDDDDSLDDEAPW